MALVSLDNLHLRFRGHPLLDGVSCRIERGERIGLLGRNGAGKTSLLRILAGELAPDNGSVEMAPETRVARLVQDVPEGLDETVERVVAAGAPEHLEPWRTQQLSERTLSQMELPPGARFAALSSGMKRRTLLARTLAFAPDLLLLDEPTNHLDLPSIEYLEGALSKWPGTLLFVTHDRAFLRKLATRILEIDRGRLFDWACDYDTFVRRKEAELEAEEKRNAEFDKKLAAEEAWIRQGIKARRTRNEGRVRALQQLRRQRQQRREAEGTAELTIQQGARSGRLVAEAKQIRFAYGDEPAVVDGFSTAILRGDKVGVIGPNGAGKTTLLRLLLGQLQPDSGSVRTGANVQAAYFDQLRDQLDPGQTAEQAVADGYDTVTVDGRPRHVLGYLKQFLFDAERARTVVRHLSGGERNRLLLAKLLAKPANLLVLDEPTNDLDTETLELLEDHLVRYEGTLLLVSHDREFLNHVVTSVIAFEEDGVREYVGGYDDWLRQRKPAKASASPRRPTAPAKTPAADNKSGRRRRSYRQQQELDALPAQIERLEAEIAALHEQMADPQYYKQDGEVLAADQRQLGELQGQLEELFARWEQLEELEP